MQTICSSIGKSSVSHTKQYLIFSSFFFKFDKRTKKVAHETGVPSLCWDFNFPTPKIFFLTNSSFQNQQLNTTKTVIAISAIRHVKHAWVRLRRIASHVPTTCCCRTTDVSAPATKDTSWRLEFALNVCTPVLRAFLAWTARNVLKDYSCRVASVKQHALMGEFIFSW